MASHSDNGEFGFQIAPMLDVLFVLLLFFMVSAGAQKHEATLTTHLPGRGTPPGPLVQVNLDISDDGQVMFNGAPTDTPSDHQLPETMARLQAAIADSPEHPVVIRPAPTTRHQRVIDVLNMCKAAQVKNLAFGTLTN
jgi:biopolymer transport protein ExbD